MSNNDEVALMCYGMIVMACWDIEFLLLLFNEMSRRGINRKKY
jgi:hypothetical protein